MIEPNFIFSLYFSLNKETLPFKLFIEQITTQNGGPLLLGPIPSGRLKNLKDVDKWASMSICLSVRGMSVTCELGCTCTVRWAKKHFQPCGT